MPKKSVKKKAKETKASMPKVSKSDEILIQNFVGLQKVIVDLSIKLNDLSNNLSKLLKLFEVSAETLVKKDFDIDKKNEQEILKKLDLISEQNKLVARGFTLMHERPEEPIAPIQNKAPIPFQRTTGMLQQTAMGNQQNQPQTKEITPEPPKEEEPTIEVPGSENQ